MKKRYVGPIPGRTLLIGNIDEYGKGEHCCANFNIHNNEKEKIITYSSVFREYNIQVNESVRQQILFCPWCGEELPKGLRDEYFNILEDDMKIEVDLDEIHQLPPEFRTDEWWKKRGL